MYITKVDFIISKYEVYMYKSVTVNFCDPHVLIYINAHIYYFPLCKHGKYKGN